MPRPSNEKMFAVDMAIKYSSAHKMSATEVFDFARKVEQFITTEEPTEEPPKRKVGFV